MKLTESIAIKNAGSKPSPTIIAAAPGKTIKPVVDKTNGYF